MFLLPPSLQDWLPEDHLSNFVSDVVDQLDFSEIESYYERDDRAQPPYHPRRITKVHVYAHCERLMEDVAFRALAAGNQPTLVRFPIFARFTTRHLRTFSRKYCDWP
jgi:transposase